MTYVLVKQDIKVVCTLSFTFKGNCGMNLKVLLEWMNMQYFFLFYIKIKKIKSIKKNILYFYIYITNSFNKYKKNVTQLVRALKFKLKGRGSNPPSPFLNLKAILAYLKKPAARPVDWLGQ